MLLIAWAGGSSNRERPNCLPRWNMNVMRGAYPVYGGSQQLRLCGFKTHMEIWHTQFSAVHVPLLSPSVVSMHPPVYLQ